ncbi:MULTISPECIES: TonB-dependent receptor [Hydrocarboniphaga]|nr:MULTISPECIES: TonB-dependent receptor [Hydrocarboniphaga]
MIKTENPIASASSCPPLRKRGMAIVASLMLAPAYAQSSGDANDIQVAAAEGGVMEEVIVKGQALRREDSGYSSTTLDQQQIRDERVSQAQELFRQVPGMNVLDYGLPGVGSAVVIRGFGGGGHGGDLGTVLDGIPLNEAMSHADGYVDFSVVVPLEIDQMTVFKGPVSALYGNFNRGGLVSLVTRKTGDYLQADLALGAFDTFDAQAAMGTPIGERQQLNLAAQAYHSDGFRPQSRTDRGTFAGRWSIAATQRLQFAVSARVHEASSAGPSYMTQAQFDRDPYGIDPNVQNDGADKGFSTFRLDANYALSETLKLLSFAYTTRQDFTRWFTRPVSATEWRQREETYDREVYGLGTSLNGRQQLLAKPINWVAGVEAFTERTDYAYYDGLDHRERLNPAINDRRAELDSLSAFAEADWALHSLFMPSLGLRADRFTGDCSLNGPETSTSPCGDLNELDNLSPKLALRMQPWSWLGLRASWAQGFALPSGFIKYAASASSLDPNVFKQTEIGATLKPVQGLAFDIAAFRLSSTNEVRTLATGDYDNFGATLRRGIETSLQWHPLAALELSAVYAYTDSEIRKNGNAALVGNEVAGVSRDTATLNARWLPDQDWAFDATWRLVGDYEIDAANSERSASFTTVDVGATRAVRSGLHVYRFYLSLDNVTDRVYSASTTRIGGQTLHAPAAPRTLRAGVQFDF